MSFIDIARTVGNVQGVIGAVRNFANSLMSFFGVDIVGLFDNDTGDQIFATARPLKLNMARAVKIMDHPLEDGAVVSDFAVNMPIVAELTLALTTNDYEQVYAAIEGYQLTRTMVDLQHKVGTVANMIIEQISHDESPEVFDAVVIVLRLRQVQLVTVQYQQLTATEVQQPTDQSTVNSGTQQPKESALYQIGSFVKGIF